ncbi:MAG: putative outer rane porin [Proteobacteria bacterium]|nr:putative outer rane porin [Pseudomonadota bacterium]
MKLAKLSLAAMVVAGLASSSFAASDTLADAFKNGKVNGELRAWYFDRDSGTGSTSADIFNTGVVLGYVTDSLYGLSLGLTFQSNYAPEADATAKKVFDGDMYGSGAVLSEAYVAYTIGKTTAKVGRQFISTPLVNGSGSRMVKEAFQGAVVLNTDLPQTTLAAGYVNKFQGRTSQVTGDAVVVDGVSDIPEFKNNAIFYGAGNFTFDGAYTVLAINKSIPNLTITAQYAMVNDVAGTVAGDTDVYVGALGYVIPMSNFKIGLDAAYQASATDKDIGLDGDMTGLKASLIDLAGFGATVAYTTTSNNDDVILGMGNGAGGAVAFAAPLITGAARTATGSTDAYKVEATYDFSKVGVTGLKVLGQYVEVKADKSTGFAARTVDNDWTYWAGQIAYDVPALKGLTLSLEYEDVKREAATTTNSDELRFRANYKF